MPISAFSLMDISKIYCDFKKKEKKEEKIYKHTNSTQYLTINLFIKKY